MRVTEIGVLHLSLKGSQLGWDFPTVTSEVVPSVCMHARKVELWLFLRAQAPGSCRSRSQDGADSRWEVAGHG